MKVGYKYSEYQYRVHVYMPDGRKKGVRSYKKFHLAMRMADTLAKCSVMRVTVTRRCDQRLLFDSHKPVSVRRYAPLLMSEAA